MKIIVLTMLCFGLVACSGQIETQESILEMSSCDLPCWNDIVIGNTSEKDLLLILSTSPLIDQESIRITNRQWFIFEIKFFSRCCPVENLFFIMTRFRQLSRLKMG